jgi:hypothetical protein
MTVGTSSPVEHRRELPLITPHQMTVMTTSKCDAKCAHCLVRSGPERDDTLTAKQIIDTVSRAHERGPLSVVVFAGGEPTLLGDELLDAIAHVSWLGIGTRLVSNAGWATTVADARAMITTLREAGLDELNISADDFHLPFIKLDNVVNAWRASKGAGLQSMVIALSSGPGSKVTPERMMAALGERVQLVFDDDGDRMPLPEPAADGTRYIISNSNVYRIGRGRGLKEAYVRWPSSPDKLDRACPWAVRSAALSPRNHLVACCGIEAEGNEVLDFGSLDEAGVPELVSRANADPLVLAISTLGPQYLMRRAVEADPSLTFRDRYAAICEVCEDVTTNPQAVAALRRNSGQLWADMTAAVVVQLLQQGAR